MAHILRSIKKMPRSVAGDRGFYSRDNETWLRSEGVREISLPVRGRKGRERQYQVEADVSYGHDRDLLQTSTTVYTPIYLKVMVAALAVLVLAVVVGGLVLGVRRLRRRRESGTS